MSQDPNQNPYGSPEDPYSGSQNPYSGAPQPPYSGPPQPPYSGPPPQPYSGPPQPYSGPPQPYSGPPQPYSGPQPPNPYEGQPSPNPYDAPPGYGYTPPSTPLPLGEAMKDLPNQYIRAITRPSPGFFAEEKGKAAWDIVWVQILIYAVISAILGYAANLVAPNRFNFSGASSASSLDPSTHNLVLLGSSIGSIAFVPIFFFIGAGILYLLAKAFKGEGTFLQQCYNTLLYHVPINILSALLLIIPILGSFAAFALSIYSIVLSVFSIMGTHRLSGGKATAVVLIPVIVAFVLACALVLFLIAAIASVWHGSK